VGTPWVTTRVLARDAFWQASLGETAGREQCRQSSRDMHWSTRSMARSARVSLLSATAFRGVADLAHHSASSRTSCRPGSCPPSRGSSRSFAILGHVERCSD
jgi:hypothetical protein